MTIRYRALAGPIRHFLRERDMTIGQLADGVGYDRSTVSAQINGSRPMTWDLASRMALHLGIAPEAIVEPVHGDDTEAVAG